MRGFERYLITTAGTSFGFLQSIQRLQKIIQAILFDEGHLEKVIRCRVKQHRVFAGDGMSCTRENVEFAIGQRMIDLQRVLIADDAMVARQNQSLRCNLFESFRINMRFCQRHLPQA